MTSEILCIAARQIERECRPATAAFFCRAFFVAASAIQFTKLLKFSGGSARRQENGGGLLDL